MKEVVYSASAWIFIIIAIVWILRQIGAAVKLFGLKMDRRFIIIQMSLMVAAILVWALGAWISKTLPIDRCLDSGGQWNYETKVCGH